jgi:hypothetical protein
VEATRWSGGPCPGCPGTGRLHILAREPDARLLFHCPGCGLAFTHAAAGEEPEYGRSLAGIAPAGSRPATEEEIRAAGLMEWARPIAPEAPARKIPPLRQTRIADIGKKKTSGGGWALLVLVKITLLVLWKLLKD